MQRERLFKRAEEALKQARRWAINLLQNPPAREPFRGALLRISGAFQISATFLSLATGERAKASVSQ